MILLIVGTRPQLIKASALVKELPCVVVNTGQHYQEMNDLYEELDVKYNLNIGSVSHPKMISKMMVGIERIIKKEKPSLVLVIGDTNSTLAGALTAKQMGVKVGHIEAGCRSYEDIPEETNRIIVDHIADYLYCSTDQEIRQLNREGLRGVVTGDLMADIVKGEWKPKGYTLVTLHRPYNVDDKKRLKAIIDDLKRFKRVIFPVHPRTLKNINKFKIDTSHIELIPPVNLEEMLKLECGADLIITDSGGVQRDAYLLGIPSLILRKKSEWTHLIEPGMLGEDVARKISEEVWKIHLK